jgi:DNA polymerase-1
MPEDLAVQMPILKEVLKAMGICICEMAGYEADDLIGTLAKSFALPTYIYTGDRDSYQLVDETTTVCYTKRGVSDLLELTAQNFENEIGLKPSQIIDLKALMGDKSDNIPGIAGVGEKSAYSLLIDYGDLDGVYAHINEIKGALQKKLEELLEILDLCKSIKHKYPNKNIWIYTGYTFESLKGTQLEILKYCDILVDGPYIESLRDLSLPFRGSTNQRIINLQDVNNK